MSFQSLQSAAEFINVSSQDVLNLNFDPTTSAFRYLRNACASGTSVQNEIMCMADLLTNTYKILMHITQLGEKSAEGSLCLLIGVQFLANLLVDNTENQQKVWNTCHDLFDECLKIEDLKVKNSCAMILYNIFLGTPDIPLQLNHPHSDLIQLTLNESTSEFALYTMELLIFKAGYIEKFYNLLKVQDRLVILEIVLEHLKKKENNMPVIKLVHLFSEYFNKNSHSILNIVKSNPDSYDPVEIIKVLDILVAASSDNEHCCLQELQKESSLLINCVFLLRAVHQISKERGNNFSMIQKISEMNEIEKDTSIQEHPAFGFKCSLIRIIGNMCWKNKKNQDEVRDLGGIQILLDCCNIDGRNPFIIQWTILAIRNITEKNQDNQKLIAEMSREGVIDSARLQEIGVTLDQDLIISPLVKN